MSIENFQDAMAMKFFGRSSILARAGSQCVSCGKAATEFRDELSRKEYQCSLLCQACQDTIFCEPMEQEA